MKNNYGMGPMNPLSIAGLSMMQGVPMGKALSDAAMMHREQQMADAHTAEVERRNQEAARAELFAQQLPQILQQFGTGGANKEQMLGVLSTASRDPKLALQLMQGLQPELSFIPDARGGVHVYDKHKGTEIGQSGSMNMGNNASSAAYPQELSGFGTTAIGTYEEAKAKAIAEQEAAATAPVKRTAGEILLDRKLLVDAGKEARAAEDTLEKLKMLSKAFSGLDTKASKFTKAGSVAQGLNSFFDTDRFAGEVRPQVQIINTAKGKLIETMMGNGMATGAGYKTEQELAKAIPSANTLPEARSVIMPQMAHDFGKKIVRKQVLDAYAALNNGSTVGADMAVDSIMQLEGLFDKDGFVSKEFLKYIPGLVKELLQEKTQIQEKPKGDFREISIE